MGEVRKVRFGPDPERLEVELVIEVTAEARRWLRTGSFARVRTLGLTNGERFIDLLPGPASGSLLPEGALIPAAAGLDVEQLVASGEDLMSNLVMISSQLAAILGRLERGEGFLGALTRDAEPGSSLAERLAATLDAIEAVAKRIESGEGTIPRLLGDPALANSFQASLLRLEDLLHQAESGPGALSALLNDATLRANLVRSVAQLEATTRRIDSILARVEAGESFLGKLLTDVESGERMARELEQLLVQLAIVAEKLASGQGTAGKLLDDPSIYEAVQDVVVGVQESALLRWLVRNRQQRGIRERYERERARLETQRPEREPSSQEMPAGAPSQPAPAEPSPPEADRALS